jgi:hypothetical protein
MGRAPTPPYCDDWRCPSRDHCTHFFGCSYEYAAMWRADEPWLTPIERRDRDGKIVCGDFEEEDLPMFTRRRFAPQARATSRARSIDVRSDGDE